MNLSAQFKDFLLSQTNPPSIVTVKNYISDINKFIRWIEARLGSDFNPTDINQTLIDSFKKESLLTYSANSVERSLSSLRKFFYFLKLESHISHSPFEISGTKIVEADPWQLKDFKNHLYVFNASNLTIKNYIIDVKQFLTWIDEVVKTDEFWESSNSANFSKINSGLIEEYKNRLLTEAHLSPVSVNRKLSSIRRFISWANEEGLIKGENQVSNLPSNNFGFVTNQTNLTSQALDSEKIIEEKPSEIKTYSLIPPLRLLQKTKNGFIAGFDNTVTAPVAEALGKSDQMIWNFKGRPVFTKRFTPIKNLRISADRNPLKSILNVPKSFYAPALISTKNFPLHKKVWHHARNSRPNWYKKYHSYTFVSYLHFSILMLFISIMGYAIFNNFDPKQQPPTFAALPSAPPRILSFQGRLTDSSDNPITKQATLRMAIYNNRTASGSALLWQEVVSPTPDKEGIFSILLGNNNPIPQSLFAQNSGLWLGVTVEKTSELTPRQQIATVAFASNAETLQGLPPITNTTATSNVVLALNSSGNLTIGGTANPVFQATGGTFTLSARTLLLTTSNNGNIRLSPNGTGVIDIQKPIQNTSNNNSFVPGSVMIEDIFAVIATSSGQAVLNISQGSTGDLILASTSGNTRFKVDNAGNITANGTINGVSINSGTISSATWNGTAIGAPYGGTGQTSYTTGDMLYASSSTVISKLVIGSNGTCLTSTGTAPSWVSCLTASGGSGYWNQSGGALFPNNSTVDLLIGGQSTSSAKFAVLNIATGTPTASISGNSGNIATYLTGLGNLQTTNGQSLVLGGTTTGVVQVNNKAGSAFTTFDTVNSLVGIGTSTPETKLDIVGGNITLDNTRCYEIEDTNGNNVCALQLTSGNNVQISGSTVGGGIQLIPGNGGSSSGIYMYSGTESTLRMKIGANLTAPSASVSGSTSFAALVADNSGSGDLFTASASGLNRFVITNAGNVGIGTAIPNALLDIAGGTRTTGPVATIAAAFAPTAGGTQTGLSLAFQNNPSATANTFKGLDIKVTDDTQLLANSVYGLSVDLGSILSTGSAKIAGLFNGGSIVQTPTNPVYVGGADTVAANNGTDTVTKTVVNGRFLYVVKATNGSTCSVSSKDGCDFQIYDISNPSSPSFVGGADLGTTAEGLSVSGKYVIIGKAGSGSACVASTGANCELVIYDVSIPSAPVVVGAADSYNAGTGAKTFYNIDISGMFVYAVASSDGASCSSTVRDGCELEIFNISNPSSIEYVAGADGNEAGTYSVNLFQDVFVSGKYAYVLKNGNATACTTIARDGCEFMIFDISNPRNPLYIGGADSTNAGTGSTFFEQVHVSDRYAYVVKGGSGATCDSTTRDGCEIMIFDITNPESPSYSGGIDYSTSGGNLDIEGIALAGKYLYIAGAANTGTCSSSVSTGCELQVYDVSTASSPSYMGGQSSGTGVANGESNMFDVYIAGRYAYVSKLGSSAADSTNTSGTCSSTQRAGCELQIYDISGVEATSVIAHSLEAGTFQLRNDGFIGGELFVAGAINAGFGGILSQGPLSIYSTQSAQLILDGKTTGKALAIFNETGNQDIFTASASGVTKFTIANNGNISFAGGQTSAFTTIASLNTSAATFTIPSTSSDTFCLLTLSNCNGGAGSNWNVANGTIYPKLASTLDLLIGGVSTASAKFAVLNVTTGTPTASISANSGNNALSIAGNGQIQTTNGQSLSLNGNGFGNVGVGTTNPGAKLDVFASSETTGTNQLIAKFWRDPTNNGGSGYIQIMADNNSQNATNIESNGCGTSPFTFGNYCDTNIVNTDTTDGAIGAYGNINFVTNNILGLTLGGGTQTGRVRIGGGLPSLPNSSGNWILSTFDVRPNSQNGGTLSIASISGNTTFAALVVDNTFASGDIFTASKSGKTHFVIDRNGNVGIGTTTPGSRLVVRNTANSVDMLKVSDSVYMYSTSIIPNGVAAVALNIRGSSGQTGDLFQIQSFGGVLTHLTVTANGLVGIGNGATSPLGTLDVRPNLTNGGTISIASISGNTSFAALVVDNSNASGDIFTASASGTTRFRIANDGKVNVGTTDSSDSDNLFHVESTTPGQQGIKVNQTATSGINWAINGTSNGAGGSRHIGVYAWASGATENWGLDVAAGYGIFEDRVGIGTTVPISQLHLTRTLSAGVTGKALAIFDQIENQDILTASKSGVTKFAINSTGNTYVGALAVASLTGVCWQNATVNGATLKELTDCSGAPTSDYAEIYPTEDGVGYGEIVAIGSTSVQITHTETDKNGNPLPPETKIVKKLAKSTSPYQEALGITSRNYADFTSAGHNSVNQSDNPLPVALVGRVPLKVSTENGPINAGDPIVSSGVPGVGMKATKAGQILARALESYDNPDSSTVGSIMVFIQNSWYDPDVQLADSGYLTLTPTVDDNFEVKRNTGETISRIGAFGDIFVARIKAGYLETGKITTETLFATSANIQTFTTQTLTALTANIGELTAETLTAVTANFSQVTTDALAIATDNITIAGQSIQDFITGIVDSRLASQGQALQAQTATDIISPLSSNNLTVKLPNDSSKFIIHNSSNSAVATIDAEGNVYTEGNLSARSASLSGDLSAKNVQTNDATVSGTLRAKKIIADEIDLSDEALAKLEGRFSSSSASITNNYYSSTPSATNDQQLATSGYGLEANNYATGSAILGNLYAQRATFEQGLMAFGPASFYEASVADRLFVGSRLSLADTSINVLGGNLELQPLKQGGIAFLGGLVEIDVDGNLKVNGNAYFGKNLEIKGSLFANLVSPLPGRDFVLELGTRDESESENHNSSFIIRNASASALLSVNNKGDLNASGAGTFNKINISLVNQALAISPTEVIATGSAGTADIQPNREELTVRNPLVTKDSLIYITPKTSTPNESVYLLRQVPGQSFTVGISNPINKKVPFNWIIIN